MTNPRDDDATLARIYAGLQDPVYDAEDENRERTARDHLAFVQRHHPRRGRLLDIGCATGMLVGVAHEAGWEAVGLDASDWSIQRARERCPGARFVCGHAETTTLEPGGFDVITMWDALEHVAAPGPILARLRGWLAQGGWIFLNVPNVESVVARLLGRHWMLLLREHLWYFSPRTLDMLLTQSGFHVEATRTNFVRFSLHAIVERLEQQMGTTRSVSWIANHVPRGLALRFPIGEMSVAARSQA